MRQLIETKLKKKYNETREYRVRVSLRGEYSNLLMQLFSYHCDAVMRLYYDIKFAYHIFITDFSNVLFS